MARKLVNFMLLDGGLGDAIAALTPIRYVIKNYSHVAPVIWVPDMLEEFAKHVLPFRTLIYPLKSLKQHYSLELPTKTTKWDGIFSPMKIHVLDYAFLKLLDENPGIQHKNYLNAGGNPHKLKDFNLPRDYVVLTTGFTADVREWPARSINEVATYLKTSGITPVFLGQTQTKTGTMNTIEGKFNDEIDYSLGINLIDKTSLLQAANIMSFSKAVVGVDNGLLHLAGCTDTPIVAGYTTVSPEIRMPVRGSQLGKNVYPVTPNLTLNCRYCQEKTNFLYGHDYRECIYKNQAAKKNLCVSQMTSDKFIAHLETILKIS